MITSAEEFVRLRDSPIPEEYHRASHDTASLDTWLQVIETYPSMRKWVAHNKTIPLEILAILAEDESHEVKRMVATKRKLDFTLFEKLANDNGEYIRQTIAINAKVPLVILKKLARDPSLEVRECAIPRLEKPKNRPINPLSNNKETL